MTTIEPIEKPERRTKGRSVPAQPGQAQAASVVPPLPPVKPDRSTSGRASPAAAAPPAPVAAVPVAQERRPATPTMRKRQSGSRKRGDPAVSDAEMVAAVHAYRKRATRPPEPPPAPAESPTDARIRNYPWYTRATSRANIYPDKRLLDPIRKPLEEIARKNGVRPYQWFSDWLEIVELTLMHLPGHVAYAKKTGKSLPFPPGTPQEEIDRWNAVFARYGSKDDQAFVYQKFAQAFQALLDAAADGIFDYIGNVYQDLELTDKFYSAQYWTPMTVAVMMAEMMQPAHNVYENIYRALTHPDNIAGQAMLLASIFFQLEPRPGQEAEDAPVVAEISSGAGDFFFTKLLPAAMPYYEPVRVMEPCVGSGVMLLAVAACVPSWMNDMGMIQYYGQDSDLLCVRMTRINVLLFGLNGFSYRCWEAAQDQETLDVLRDPERQSEWTAIREKLDAEKAARRAEEAVINAARTAEGAAGMHVDVEDVTGADGRSRKKKTLRAEDGTTQLELF